MIPCAAGVVVIDPDSKGTPYAYRIKAGPCTSGADRTAHPKLANFRTLWVVIRVCQHVCTNAFLPEWVRGPIIATSLATPNRRY